MQKKKNIQLLAVFLLLLIWTVIFINMRETSSRIAVDEYKFAVQDTSSIRMITIRKPSVPDLILEIKSGQWRVNDDFDLDPSMQNVLMAVLNQVRVKRAVPRNKIESISRDLEENGHRVEIIPESGETIKFLAGGNGISISYFKFPDEDPYVVYLPGYESYVSGIFEVTVNDWRDRLIFQTSWLGLKQLSIIYPGDTRKNVIIKPDNNLYSVENVSDLDTAALMNFIDQVSYFYTDQYISEGQIPAYDSLRLTVPLVLFSIEAISLDQTMQIRFFPPLPDEEVRLGVINGKDMCLFRNQRINFIFKEKEDFTL
ncbi:MAG: hypothetical protein KFF73_17350 [Cyclobacteriaceae bacterium]|nr:hypothetical protein [Cyclobacteriaceae bacterium]